MSKPSIRARVRIQLGETSPGISYDEAGEPRRHRYNLAFKNPH